MGFLSKIVKFVLIPIIAIVGGLCYFGIDDGQRFCTKSDPNNPPVFQFSENGEYVNVGGKACIPDIVEQVINMRAGSDGLVGTLDDTMDVNATFVQIVKMLRQEFPHGYWAETDWHLNHNAAVLGTMKLVYTDGNEYILLFGNPLASSGYSGTYPYDCHDFQIDGEQRNFFVGQLTANLYTPNYKQKREEGVAAHFHMVLPKYTQKGYEQRNGGWMLEYGHGNLVTCLYDGVLQPTLFVTNDWKSAYITISGFAEGVLNNNMPALAKMLGMSHAHKFNTQKRKPNVVVA